MRFLHTADWHLGKRLNDFSLADVQAELVHELVELVKDARPDAVVVAGDVFDTQVPHLGALELWEQAVEAIVGELGVTMLVIPGNHDHPGRLATHRGLAGRAGLRFFAGLGDCATPVTIEGVDFFGVPFHKPVHVNAHFRDEGLGIGDFDYGSAMRHVLERSARRTAGRPAVLIAHAFVDGAGEEPDGEDAVMVGGAGGVEPSAFDGFAYVALGHIHSARRLGGAEVRYSGSLFPYSFSEGRPCALDGVAPTGGHKSVNVVEVDSRGSVTVEAVPLAPSTRVDVVDGLSFDEVIRRARALPDADRGHFTLVRITDVAPVPDAIVKLREVLPLAVLEQPAAAVTASVVALTGDHREIRPDEALRQFYEHVYGEALSPLEEELLAEVMADEEPA